MDIVVWGGDIVARYSHDIQAGGRHNLGGIALVVGGSDWGHRVGGRWDVRVCLGDGMFECVVGDGKFECVAGGVGSWGRPGWEG